MYKLQIYNQENLPQHLKCQILSFLRIEWPDGFIGENRLRNWISHKEDHPIDMCLVEKDILISHLEIVWKYLNHAGVTYKTYGLTGVFTYPQFRRQGYGLQLLNAAREYILKQDADIVLFNSDKTEFYEKGGFERVDSVVTLKGEPDHPETDDSYAFMLFISDKGKKGRVDFETKPVYFGSTTW